jgi:DNA-binding transcriptional ArsR family regulator
MAARKKAANDAYEVVSDSIHEASEVMKAMSSETRLKILCALSEGGEMARLTGLEPATSGVTGRHSNQLSYSRAQAGTLTS